MISENRCQRCNCWRAGRELSSWQPFLIPARNFQSINVSSNFHARQSHHRCKWHNFNYHKFPREGQFISRLLLWTLFRPPVLLWLPWNMFSGWRTDITGWSPRSECALNKSSVKNKASRLRKARWRRWKKTSRSEKRITSIFIIDITPSDNAQYYNYFYYRSRCRCFFFWCVQSKLAITPRRSQSIAFSRSPCMHALSQHHVWFARSLVCFDCAVFYDALLADLCRHSTPHKSL